MPAVFLTDWFSAHIPKWREILQPYKDAPDLSFLEIGSFDGRSACWLLENVLTHPSARLTCIDLFEIGEELREIDKAMQLKIPPDYDIGANFDRNIAEIGATEKVTKLRGPSSVMLRKLPLSSFDIVYIDGSHRAPNVLRDIIGAWDLLKPRGIMILDDYRWNFPGHPLKSPRPAIDAFLAVFDGEFDLLHKDFQVVVRKRDPDVIAAPGSAHSSL